MQAWASIGPDQLKRGQADEGTVPLEDALAKLALRGRPSDIMKAKAEHARPRVCPAVNEIEIPASVVELDPGVARQGKCR